MGPAGVAAPAAVAVGDALAAPCVPVALIVPPAVALAVALAGSVARCLPVAGVVARGSPVGVVVAAASGSRPLPPGGAGFAGAVRSGEM